MDIDGIFKILFNIFLVSDNGFSSSTFSHSCCTQTIIAQFYPSSVSTVPDCSPHQSRQSLLVNKRSPTNVMKKRALESTPLVFSSLPNIWAFYNPPSLNYSCKMTNTKTFPVIPSSVQYRYDVVTTQFQTQLSDLKI